MEERKKALLSSPQLSCSLALFNSSIKSAILPHERFN